MSLYQVLSGYFTAGVEVNDGKITFAAPILGWATGKEITWFKQYCRHKKWTIRKLL